MLFNVVFTATLSAAAATAAATPKRQSNSIDFSTLQNAANTVNEAIGTLNDLENNVDSTIDGIASQNNQQPITEALSKAHAKVEELANSWGELANALGSASETFQDTEDNISDKFG